MKSIIHSIAEKTHLAPQDVNKVIDCFSIEFHKRVYEYPKSSSYYNYVETSLGADISQRSYFHLIHAFALIAEGTGDTTEAASYRHRLDLSYSRDEKQNYWNDTNNW